jgi:non-specific serine/threonine protein kinase
LAICRRLGERWGGARTLTELGLVAIAQGDFRRARDRLGESLGTWREIGAPLGLARSLDALALLAATTGHARRGARLLGAADALRAAIDAPPHPVEATRRERLIGAALRVLDRAAFDQARGDGRAMPLEDAIADALADEAYEDELAQVQSREGPRSHARTPSALGETRALEDGVKPAAGGCDPPVRGSA